MATPEQQRSRPTRISAADFLSVAEKRAALGLPKVADE